jgi:hypothetical protein
MKTAVEWYCNEMESLRVDSEINNMKVYDFLIRRAEIFQQAKEMEKEQIMDAFNYAQIELGMEANEYYEQFFKSE